MKIFRAEHLGMCFGVRDAIALAVKHSQSEPLTILGDLVHNESVNSQLRSHGINIEQQIASVGTNAIMITAHGASQTVIRNAREQGFKVTEATCPLVHVAHRAISRLVSEGYHPVIIGKRGHVEVRGLTEDLPDFDVVLSEGDILDMQEHERFGIAAQTTQPIDKVRRLVGLIQSRFPVSEVRFVDTVCQPTKQRQTAAIELAKKCDVVIVIGGLNSNNTRELVNTCSGFCSRVHHVQNAGDLRPEWFAEAQAAGITAGTSTPDSIIQEVERWLMEYNRVGFQSDLPAKNKLPEVAVH